jgi:predicted kinase
MLTLTMTKGLPGSGKSTEAKRIVAKAQPGTLVRINKDDLRTMLHDSVWHGKNERRVVRARNALVEAFLGDGVSVIVDDTNLNPNHEKELRRLAAYHGAEFKVSDHTAVPLHTCIKRDLQRDRSVGEKVIRDMYNQYLAPKPAEAPPYDPAKPNMVLVDIDGTLARMVGRSPFEWDRVGEDEPISEVIDLVNTLRDSGAEIVFLSGRDGCCYDQTRAWLELHVGKWTREAYLHMRAPDDMRKDSVVKEEIYRAKIEPFYNVWFVLDDRDQVVEMWRLLGLRCLQVAPGAF